MKIEYRDGGNLYVLASNFDKVQFYAGADSKKHKLNKLGSSEWNKTRTKVEAATRDIAKELVHLYAVRSERHGHKFGVDTVWQKEFETMKQQILGGEDLNVDTSQEYAGVILHALETKNTTCINGNVLNTGLITNLPDNCCVEVPCMIDKNGIQPTFVALGQAKISLFIAILRKIILLIPLAIVLPHWFGVWGVYNAEIFSNTI